MNIHFILHSQMSRLPIVLSIFLLVFPLISNLEADASNSNLFVSAENPTFENRFAGSMVVEVIVNDPQIDDTGEGKGEPDVTINGKDLRMVQTTDGNWYAYFANLQKAQIADQIAFDTGVSGQGLDFGVFCSRDTTIFGVSFSDSDGFSFPGDSGITGTDGTTSFQQCTGTPTSSLFENNVVRQPKSINTNSNVPPGQIGLTASAWPIIQLFSFDDVEIQYNRAGGVQKVELEFDEIENASLTLDRTSYPKNSQVFIVIDDIQLNQDPTSNDSWTFNINSPNAVFYQAFDENGNDAANGTPALVNLVPFLSSLGFEDNGLLAGNLGSVAELRINDNQPDSSVSNGIAYSQIITLVESEPNSAIFESFDHSDQSTIGIKNDAPRGQTATVSYNSKSYSILSGTFTGSISMDSDTTELQPGKKQTVTINDPDQNLNSGSREHLDVFRSSAIIPSLQIGQPITLEKSSDVQFYPLSTSALTSPPGIFIPSSVPDTNSDRLILDTRPPVSNISFEKISIDLGITANEHESLFIDVNEDQTEGTNWINYDLRSFQQLDVNDFSDTTISLHFGLSDPSPITIVDSGDISQPQGLFQLDNDDITSVKSKSGNAFLVIDFGSSNGGMISDETDTQPIVVDFFSFGLRNSNEVNNAIYRLELKETSRNSGTFAGTMEFTQTNQLNFFEPSLIKTLKTINKEIKFLVNERLLDQKGVVISYSDIAAVGTTIDVSEKREVPTASGTVNFSPEYGIGRPVVISLYDPDINVKHDTIESYLVNDDPNSENVDTVGNPEGLILLEVLIKGERFQRCTIDGVEHGGLAATGFTLTETGLDTGTFEGVFRIPLRICNEDGTELISIKGGSIEAKYHDLRDNFGKPNIFSFTLSNTSTPNFVPPQLNGNEFKLPNKGQTTEITLTGKVVNYNRGTSIKVIVTHPDNSKNEHSLLATKDGNYKGLLTLKNDSLIGKYEIAVDYLGTPLGNISFNVLKGAVPGWIKNNADWWSRGQITDDDFIKGIEHLIKEEIIVIPESQSSIKSEKNIPSWIKNTASWWSKDLISEDEFVSALEFLVKEGIIRL